MKNLFILLLVSSSSTLFGQSVTTEVADSVCSCLESKLNEMPETEFQAALSSCIGKSMSSSMQDLMKEHDLEGITVENIHELQSIIVAELKENCEVVENGDAKLPNR